jgi:hypothetical protein
MKEFPPNHYERAFENWLIDRRVPYVRAEEHKRPGLPPQSVKNFDFLVYPGPDRKLIVEVKGRTFAGTTLAGLKGLECWVTADDIESLQTWRQALGRDHEAILVFAYRVASADVDFDGHGAFRYDRDTYLFFYVPLDDYCRHMTRRSPKWQTMTLPAEKFRQYAADLSSLLP